MSVRAWIVALALVGCTPPAPPPPAPRSSIAPSSPAPPDPCERAAIARARVPALLDAGKLDRAVRVIQQAASLCPPTAASTRAAEIDALLSLSRVEEARAVAALVDREPGATAEARAAAARAREAKVDATPVEALIEAAFGAAHAGKEAEARRLFDRAAASVELASGEKLRLQVRNGYGMSSGLPWESNGIFPDEINSVFAAPAFSSDGKRAAVADGDHILVGDRAARRVRLRLAGHGGNIAALAFSLDGRRLASASYDGTVRVWDVAAGKSLFTFPIERFARALRFVRGGSVLVCAAAAVAVAWDLATGKEIARVSAKGPLVAVDPDGLVTVTDAARLPADRLDVLHGGRLVGSAPGAAAYTPDARLGVLAFRDVIEIRRYPGATLVRKIRAKARFGGAWISSDGKHVAVGEIDDQHSPIRKVRTFVTATGAALGVFSTKGDGPYVSSWLRGFTADVKLVRGSDADQTAIDPRTGEDVRKLAAAERIDEVALDDMSGPRALDPDAIAFSADGDRVAVLAHQEGGAEEGPTRLAILDARGGPPRDLEGAQFFMAGLRFTPDRGLVGWTSEKILRWSPTGGAPSVLLDAAAKGHEIERVSAGTTIALARHKKRRFLLDVASGAEISVIPPDLEDASPVISPDGAQLMLGKGRQLSLLDVRTGKVTAGPDLPGEWGAAAFTRDGRSAVVVTIGSSSSVRAHVLSLANGALRPLGEPASEVLLLGAVGDHQLLLGVTELGTSLLGKMRLFDVEQGAFVRDLRSKLWQTGRGVLSPDERLLASASDPEAVVGLWSLETGEPLAALRVLQDRRAAYVYAADGHLEVFGDPADVLRGNAFCQAGARVYPVELCEERFITQGLLRSLLAGDTAYRDP